MGVRRRSLDPLQMIIQFVLTAPIAAVEQALVTATTILTTRIAQGLKEPALPHVPMGAPVTALDVTRPRARRVRAPRAVAHRPMTSASAMPVGEATPLGQSPAAAPKRRRGRPLGSVNATTAARVAAETAAAPVTAPVTTTAPTGVYPPPPLAIPTRPVESLPPSQALPEESGPLGEPD